MYSQMVAKNGDESHARIRKKVTLNKSNNFSTILQKLHMVCLLYVYTLDVLLP